MSKAKPFTKKPTAAPATAAPPSRTEFLAAFLEAARGRRVWGIDPRGHGGEVVELGGKTDGWRVPVGELRWVCFEGGLWVELPAVVPAPGVKP